MTRLPALFVGHGSPTNAIDNNAYTHAWQKIAKLIPRPKAILAISAHWFIPEVALTAQEKPPTIHDFGNFAKSLFEVQYPAPGSPELAKQVSELLSFVNDGQLARLDTASWGLDHGTWSVLKHMYPDADIPVIQLSIDSSKPDWFHYEVGQKISRLRDEGVLVFGTGNIVHNFKYLDLSKTKGPEPWALEFEKWVKDTTQDKAIDRSDFKNYPLTHWRSHKLANKAQSSPDHFLPVLYILGTAHQDESITWPYQGWDLGSFSMSSFIVGN